MSSTPASPWSAILLLSPSAVLETPQISFHFFFPGLPCSHGGKNETCTFAIIFQLACKFSFPFN